MFSPHRSTRSTQEQDMIIMTAGASRELRREQRLPTVSGDGHLPMPQGLPLTFQTGEKETTVYALRKPLGLVFEKRQPIKINENKEGHGKDLGIRKGWILTHVNNVNVLSMPFQEADDLLHAAINKLPGDHIIPMRWDTGDGQEITVFARRKPLGLVFERGVLPIKITMESRGHGKDLGIRVGWILKSINNIDVSR